jgi:predicted metal-dependent hydrolase
MTPGLTDIPAPGDRGIPRYSQRPFPAYRYVPGLHAHPHRDPAGHSYQPQVTPQRHAPWRPQNWRTLDDWLYGVDLFNQFYFWEAHEAWEGLWAAAPRATPPSLVLQGLIQITAGLLKTHLHVTAGARVLSSEGVDKLRRAARGERRLLGLDLSAVADRFAEYFAPLQADELPLIGAAVPVLRLDHFEFR